MSEDFIIDDTEEAVWLDEEPPEEPEPEPIDEPEDEQLGRLLNSYIEDNPEALEAVADETEPEEEEPVDYESVPDDFLAPLLDQLNFDEPTEPEEQDLTSQSDFTDATETFEFVDEEGLSFFLDNLKNLFIQRYNTVLTDLNDATETGMYVYNNASANIPTSTGGCVLVLKYSSNYSHQLAVPNHASGQSNLYKRMKTANGWSSWTMVEFS